MTVEMNKFLEKLDTLCWEYHIEIKPTHPVLNDEHPTISIINGDEVVKLLYIDGDGNGKQPLNQNKMEKIPTAEEFWLNSYFCDSITQEDKKLWLECNYQAKNSIEIMIEFAKLHVETALKSASEKANMLGETQHNNGAPNVYKDFVYVSDSNGPDYGFTVNKDSILNSYPLENIK